LAQDISGVWVGNYERSIFMDHPDKLVVEIYVYNDSLITGISHLYYGKDKYEHYKIYGVYDKTNSSVYFSEDSTIAVKLGFMITNCMGNYIMKLRVSDTMMTLKGRWSDNNPRLFGCQLPASGYKKILHPIKRNQLSNHKIKV
jgi:hypothetical protein